MSILSDKPEKYICEDYDVSVQLHNPQKNQEYINIQELGLSDKGLTSPQHVFNIPRRLMELFEGMPVDILDNNVLHSSISDILTQPGWVCIDKEKLMSTILITYHLDEHDEEILTISLQHKQWVC